MKSHIKTTRFWLAWIFASLLVYPLTFAILFTAALFLSTVGRMLYFDGDIFYTSSQAVDTIIVLVVASGFGGIVGFSIGVLQNMVIKRYFHIELSNWKRATVIGGMVAAPLMALAMHGITTYMSNHYWELMSNYQYMFFSTLESITPMVLYVLILSTVQVMILRKYVKNAWLWIMANTVAGLMFSMLVANAFDPGFGNWLLAAIAQGAVTGFAMLWLLHRLNQEIEHEDEREFAYQHVPIEADEPQDPSVWDDAI